VPLGFVPLGFVPLGFVPLGFVPLGFVPLGFVPLGFVPLGFVPLGFVPCAGSVVGVFACFLLGPDLAPPVNLAAPQEATKQMDRAATRDQRLIDILRLQ
jgi:hypothetical protein